MISVLKDIKDTKIINGNTDTDYFDIKWNKINLYTKYIHRNLNIIRPCEIYDFFEKSDFINEGYYSFMKYIAYLIQRKNRYYINTVRFTCTCKYYKYNKTICKHLKKYEYYYNISLVFMNYIGYHLSRDIVHLFIKDLIYILN